MSVLPAEPQSGSRGRRRHARPADPCTVASPAPHATSFGGAGVPAPLVAALAAAGITAPFPIQAATLSDALAGRDILGRGQTGSGETLGAAAPVTLPAARLAAVVAAPAAGRGAAAMSAGFRGRRRR